MKSYISIFISILTVIVASYFSIAYKHTLLKANHNIGVFDKVDICAKSPIFLERRNIQQPVIVDLTQIKYKGIAMHYGHDFSQTLHHKKWEKYDYFSTEAIDNKGNIYLAPTPFVSINSNTFGLQKNLYRMDTITSDIEIFKSFDDVSPTSENPYGINAVVFDCDDSSLWVGAIDESTYSKENGVIYHIDTKSKKILERIENIDAFSLYLVKTDKGKYLLVGSAKRNILYAYSIDSNHRISSERKQILELPVATERIRNIVVSQKNTLLIEAMPFTYSMIAESDKHRRTHYRSTWDDKKNIWFFQK